MADINGGDSDRTGPPSSGKPTRPGVIGAIKDAAEAIINYGAPKVLKPKNNPHYDSQSTDSNNDYPQG